ncbi:helix-turn-helix domain-containing protein [Bifidobacterium vansinderenii]|uniref:helix-turn-helix domain-containing protein n=1 Tax=Bifidobacterium vansinderenii TaxID=1984871 RepID=UPI0011777B01
MSTQTLEPDTQAIPLGQIISTNVRVGLAMRGKNQSDLSRALGVSRALISQKVNGATAWTIPDMEKIGLFLKVAPSRLLDPNGFLVADHRRGDVGPQGLEPWTDEL